MNLADELLWRQLVDLPYFRAMLRAVEAKLMLSIQLPSPVLDVGSGDGHFAQATFDQQVDVGIDPAWPAIVEARSRGAYRLLCQADGGRLPYADRVFASAFSNSVLEHIPGLDSVLREVRRVLRPGALFAITVPNPGYSHELAIPALLDAVRLRPLSRGYRTWFMWMSRTHNLLDENGWAARLGDAGFDLEESQRYFSPSALRMLELGHYMGFPCLLVRWLTGRWILVPRRWNLRLTKRAVEGYIRDEIPVEDGTYSFLLARRR